MAGVVAAVGVGVRQRAGWLLNRGGSWLRNPSCVEDSCGRRVVDCSVLDVLYEHVVGVLRWSVPGQVLFVLAQCIGGHVCAIDEERDGGKCLDVSDMCVAQHERVKAGEVEGVEI